MNILYPFCFLSLFFIANFIPSFGCFECDYSFESWEIRQPRTFSWSYFNFVHSDVNVEISAVLKGPLNYQGMMVYVPHIMLLVYDKIEQRTLENYKLSYSILPYCNMTYNGEEWPYMFIDNDYVIWNHDCSISVHIERPAIPPVYNDSAYLDIILTPITPILNEVFRNDLITEPGVHTEYRFPILKGRIDGYITLNGRYIELENVPSYHDGINGNFDWNMDWSFVWQQFIQSTVGSDGIDDIHGWAFTFLKDFNHNYTVTQGNGIGVIAYGGQVVDKLTDWQVEFSNYQYQEGYEDVGQLPMSMSSVAYGEKYLVESYVSVNHVTNIRMDYGNGEKGHLFECESYQQYHVYRLIGPFKILVDRFNGMGHFEYVHPDYPPTI